MPVGVRIASWLCAVSLVAVSQAQSSPAAKKDRGGAFTLASSAFASGSTVPEQYSCKGQDRSPALEWKNAPAKTVSFAIIMDDPDAPAGDWVHWVIWDVPASKHVLTENVVKSEQLEDGSHQGRNSFNRVGYNGPCPPPGPTHRYFFRIYALDGKLSAAPGADRAAVEAAMKGHIVGTAEYMGTFHR